MPVDPAIPPGVTMRTLADQAGVSYTTVRRYLRELGEAPELVNTYRLPDGTDPDGPWPVASDWTGARMGYRLAGLAELLRRLREHHAAQPTPAERARIGHQGRRDGSLPTVRTHRRRPVREE